MRSYLGLALALCILGLPMPAWATELRWLSYYADAAKPEELAGFDLLVLDPDRHPGLEGLAERGKLLVGYLSLGEVERFRGYFGAVKGEGSLLGPNPQWPESQYVDLRDPRWQRRVVEELVPAILRKGFGGIFLDTLDNAAYLEAKNPKAYAGMTTAAAHLIKELRLNYPQITIIMNRGYELLPQVEDDIDMVLAESLYSSWDFKKKTCFVVPDSEYREQVTLLKAAMTRRPGLRVLSLDYWDAADRPGMARIYQLERANGFSPYVATIGLDHVVQEPRP